MLGWEAVMEGGMRTAGMMYCQKCCRSRFSPLSPAHSPMVSLKFVSRSVSSRLHVLLSCVPFDGRRTGNTGLVQYHCRCRRPLYLIYCMSSTSIVVTVCSHSYTAHLLAQTLGSPLQTLDGQRGNFAALCLLAFTVMRSLREHALR